MSDVLLLARELQLLRALIQPQWKAQRPHTIEAGPQLPMLLKFGLVTVHDSRIVVTERGLRFIERTSDVEDGKGAYLEAHHLH